MNGFYYNLDNARIDAEDNSRYIVDGWVYSQQGKSYEFQVFADGMPVDFILTRHTRPDVIEVLHLEGEVEDLGFMIVVEDLLNVLGTHKSFEVYIASGDEKQLIFQTEVSEILNEYNCSIRFNIERVDMERSNMVIQGWAFDTRNSAPLELVVLDDEGKTIKAQVAKVVRPDVNAAYELEAVNYLSGFNVSMPRETFETKVLRLRFVSDLYYKEYAIDMKAFDAKFTTMAKLKKALSNKEENKRIFKEGGFRAFYDHIRNELNPNYAEYNTWLKMHSVTKAQLKEQRQTAFDYEPLISIIIPLYNTPLNYLKELLDSLVNQSYKKIEVCLADGSTKTEVGEFIRKKYKHDSRIRYKKLEKNGGISENTNEALAMASGDYIMLSDHDDVVTLDAVYEIVKAINKNPETVDVIYTDEDKVTMDGKDYFDPHFKPDFGWDYFRSNNYICHIFVAKKTIFDQIGGFRSEYDGAQDFDLILRCCELAQEIVHIPKVLYHWRSHPASTAGNPESKMYAYEAGRKALEQHYERLGMDAEVSLTGLFGRYRSTFPVKGEPLVSIIIPTKDHIDDLELCLSSLKEKTTYQNYEVIVVENNSTEAETFAYYEEMQKKYDKVRLVVWKDIFNYAAINNYAAQFCNGEYLILLNNDIEVITENWIEEMLGYCQREEVGIVGAKLYYPDDTVQHAGVIIGMGGIAGHVFTGTPGCEYGYQARLISPQDLSAVTAACMMVKRSVFDAVEGLDERYKVAFNDVDFCMKVRALGKLIVYTPYAEMYHYESKSRGKEETPEQIQRFQSEVALFEEKWADVLEAGDPYYSPNLALNNENCTLRW